MGQEKHERMRNCDYFPILLIIQCSDHKDTGYPHDGRADKDSYPHDRRADKDSYRHDRHIQYIMLSL